LFGTVDLFDLASHWWRNGGIHITDVTNAGRTLLMNLHTLDWDADILAAMQIPAAMLPRICSSSDIYGHATGILSGVPVAGALGDQHAAMARRSLYRPR
jgi:glycerol kinase